MIFIDWKSKINIEYFRIIYFLLSWTRLVDKNISKVRLPIVLDELNYALVSNRIPVFGFPLISNIMDCCQMLYHFASHRAYHNRYTAHASPAFFSKFLKYNQAFDGYFGSSDTSTNSRFSAFLLVDILFDHLSVSVSSITFRNNFRTKQPISNLWHKIRTQDRGNQGGGVMIIPDFGWSVQGISSWGQICLPITIRLSLIFRCSYGSGTTLFIIGF